jgi:hypothetical protein
MSAERICCLAAFLLAAGCGGPRERDLDGGYAAFLCFSFTT